MHLGWAQDILWLLLIAAVPLSVGVAILRYRLFDNRSRDLEERSSTDH